jgi:hypothetical protein
VRGALSLGRRALLAASGSRHVATEPLASSSWTRDAGRTSRRVKRAALGVTRGALGGTRAGLGVTRAGLGVTRAPREGTRAPRGSRSGSRGLNGWSLGSIRLARRGRVARLGASCGTRSTPGVPRLVRRASLRASRRPFRLKRDSLAEASGAPIGARSARWKPRVPVGVRRRSLGERSSAPGGIRAPARARSGALRRLRCSLPRPRWTLRAARASLHEARGALPTPRVSLIESTGAQIKPSESPLEPRDALLSFEVARGRKSVPHGVSECVAPWLSRAGARALV